MEKTRDELLEGYPIERRVFGTFFAFGNKLQTAADSFYEEITSKQFFMIMCLRLFQEKPPTIKELSHVMGSSHQNVKQIALKLERQGYVEIVTDEKDRRKSRLKLTPKAAELREKYSKQEVSFMEGLFEGIPKEDLAATYRTMAAIEENLAKIKRNEGVE